MGNPLKLARTGAGGKPRARDRKRRAASDVAVYRPRDLTADERFVWNRWAPAAMAKGTLTLHTVAGFRFLVGIEVERMRMKDEIDSTGILVKRMTLGPDGQERIESITPHPLIAEYGRKQKLVEVNLARFGLTAFGKKEPEIVPAVSTNPWAGV